MKTGTLLLQNPLPINGSVTESLKRVKKLLSEFAIDHLYKPALESDQLDPRNVTALVQFDHLLNRQTLCKYPNLAVVSCAFSGFDKVDLAGCKARGVECYYSPNYSTFSVVELELASVLGFYRSLPWADILVRSHKGNDSWSSAITPGLELRGKTVGVIGLGSIGRHAAKIFSAMGCTIIATNPRHVHIDSVPIEFVTLENLAMRADVILLHCQLIEKTAARKLGKRPTEKLINRRIISLMKRSALIVNMARGGIIDSAALADALNRRRIAGAILDVFEEEPLPIDHPLTKTPNTRLSGHIAYRTVESYDRLYRKAIENIKFFVLMDATNRLVANPARKQTQSRSAG